MARENGTSFFRNVDCAHFPCHDGIAPEDFNCLLCYCPLYALGAACGGNFRYTERGRKDCSACNIPHRGEEGVALVKRRYPELAALAAREQQAG